MLCFMDAGDPQGEAGPGEGGKLQRVPKISGMPPRNANRLYGQRDGSQNYKA